MWGHIPAWLFLLRSLGSGCLFGALMATPTTVADAITNAALAGVAEVEVDGRRVKAMPIDDQIKAAQFAASTASASKNHVGLRFRVFQPGGGG